MFIDLATLEQQTEKLKNKKKKAGEGTTGARRTR